jgi:thioredoxin reductase
MNCLATVGIIGKGPVAIALAAKVRRAGISCHTEYTGKRDSQYRRADENAVNVYDANKPEDVAALERYMEAMT